MTNASQINARLIRVKSPWDDIQNIEVRLKVENLLGYGAYGPFVSLTVEDDTGSPSVRFSTIVPITICVLFVCVIFVVALSRYSFRIPSISPIFDYNIFRYVGSKKRTRIKIGSK